MLGNDGVFCGSIDQLCTVALSLDELLAAGATHGRHLYLAQSPILQARSPGEPLRPMALGGLAADLDWPRVLVGAPILSVNLWAGTGG